jgi:succinate dehydrogenase / fumarate reductase cytochrome b subunit
MSASAIGFGDSRVARFWNATVGKKIVMAVSGIVLAGFVCLHMLGNMNFFRSVEAMNDYAKLLRFEPALLWAARGFLLAMVVAHVWASVQLALLNKLEARPVGYVKKKSAGSTYASRTMYWSGPIILAFVVYHLMHFTWGAGGTAFEELRPSENIVAGFSVPAIAIVYIVAMGMLMLHLYHGVWSMFQTLGFNHPRYTPMLKKLAAALSILLFAGFSSIPVAVMLGYRPPLQ